MGRHLARLFPTTTKLSCQSMYESESPGQSLLCNGDWDHSFIRTAYDSQNMKYVPTASLHIVGSWTDISPVTVPGFGCANEDTDKARIDTKAVNIMVREGVVGQGI